jgi:fatty acid desaturase
VCADGDAASQEGAAELADCPGASTLPERSVNYGVSRQETSTWLGTLPAETRAAIRALHDVRPVWNWVLLMYPAAWALGAAVILAVPTWPVRLLGYLVIGTAIHAMAIFVHEHSHGSVFRNRVLDRWIGFLMGVPVLVSYSAYRTLHAFHHRHTRAELDPDEFLNVTKNRVLLSLLFYSWLVIGTPVYLAHVAWTALTRGTSRERRDVIVEYALMAVIWGGVLWSAARFDGFGILLHCWALPMIVAMAFGNLRSWAEHTMTQPGHPLTQTRTVLSNRLVSFLMCNLNYHLEHHLCPGIPWYNLPKLHAMLRDDYRRAGSFIYRSYLRFLWDAIRIGIHGIARDTVKG